MKIQSQLNYLYSQNQPKPQAFKGYFACPLKEVHIQPDFASKNKQFLKEMFDKCSQYFDVVVQLPNKIVRNFEELKFNSRGGFECASSFPWGQDNKLFLDNAGETELAILHSSHSTAYVPELAKELGIKLKEIDFGIEGGNCFLGKKDNGEPIALIGKNAMGRWNGEKNPFYYFKKSEIAKSLNIEPKNLHVISQPDFHLDMVLRPLEYPYILVGDSKLTLDLARKNNVDKDQIKFLTLENRKRVKNKEPWYASPDKIVKELKSRGFKPIKIPGLINDKKLNFMNAIVHKEPNGDLIYITNKTHIGFETGIDFEKIFVDYLKAKVPQIKKVIFIDGDGFIENELKADGGGGVHCRVAELPDFKK